MKRHATFTGILGKTRLEFKDNAELERYYEDKYRRGGYDGEGCHIHGIDVSRIYHRARHDSALRFLDPHDDDVILDAGCGDGSLTARLAPRCRRVCAIDIAGNAIDASVRAMSRVEFRKMNVEALDYPDGTFDKIVCVETLEHLLHPGAALDEFRRVLVPGGLLVVTYPTVNRTSIKTLQRRFGIGRPLEISEHLTEWSYDEVVDHVRVAGFDVLRSEGLVFDFGMLSRLKQTSRMAARGLTALSLTIRRFPRNSSFVSVACRKQH
jgi:2-polyprenyl-3-methyl-5-hydroxy-6-metoxy-1,4-benzoquinol methylase